MKTTFDVLLSRLRMKQLQLILALHEHRSLHKAANAMFMTQSASSKALAEVESMLGATLFERSRTGLTPNRYGSCVIGYAQLLTSGLASLCEEVAEIRAGTSGRLAIGTIMGAVAGPVSTCVAQLNAELPNLQIEVIEDTSANLLALLEDGRLDVVVGRVSVSTDPDRFSYTALAHEPVCLVVGAQGSVPRQSKKLSMASLADYQWVLYPDGMPLRTLCEREMDLAGIAPPRGMLCTASTFVTVALLQENPRLVSVLPSSAASFFARFKMLRILPIRLESKSQTFGAVRRTGAVLSHAATRFLASLQAHADQAPETLKAETHR